MEMLILRKIKKRCNNDNILSGPNSPIMRKAVDVELFLTEGSI